MAKENSVYYWLKLKEDFFQSKELKIIRKMPSGSEIIIVLLKLQLHSLRKNGIIEIDGICETHEEEIAVILDEDLKLVQMALATLERFSLIDGIGNDLEITNFSELIGKETASTIRSRKSRAKKNNNPSQELIECEILDEIPIEKPKKQTKRFTKPTVQEIREYVDELAGSIDAERFYDHYESNGWRVGGKSPMKNWKATVRNWEKNNKERSQQNNNNNNNNRFGDNVFAEMLEGNYVE